MAGVTVPGLVTVGDDVLSDSAAAAAEPGSGVGTVLAGPPMADAKPVKISTARRWRRDDDLIARGVGKVVVAGDCRAAGLSPGLRARLLL